MKAGRLKKIPALVFILSLLLAPAVPAFATKPYFKTYGSDVMTGGVFFDKDGKCDTNTYYQTAGYSNVGLGIPADDRTGGILAYAKDQGGGSNKAAGGSSSQYADYSLGYVEHDGTKNWGFYSNGAGAVANSSNRADDLTFANTPTLANAWGGKFEGSSRQSHCIPDYYSQVSSAGALPPGCTVINCLSNGSYKVTPAPGTNFSLTSGVAPIAAGKKINIYVDGNVYIGDNIINDVTGADDAPKIRVVARGNIYIGPDVQFLDGWYVAQPDMRLSASEIMSDKTGYLYTCHPNTLNSVDDTFILSKCLGKLTVNGALTAKKINLTRTEGDISTGNNFDDDLATALASPHMAEIINYSPDMVVGGGFTGGDNSSGPLPIDSLISLPPVF